MKSVFFIDPQSGDNLAMYDYELISRFKDVKLYFVCSKTYNYKPLNNINLITAFNYTRKSNSVHKGISYITSLFKLYKDIIKYRPDIIHIQWFKLPLIDYWFYRMVKKKLHLILFHTVHNTLPHVINRKDYERYQKLYKICNHFITHTETSAVELSEKFEIDRDLISVAPHGPLKYNFHSIDVNKKILEIKNKYRISAKYVVSLLGYQSFYKGTDLAVNAWRGSNMLLGNPDICFIIAGQNRDYRTERMVGDSNLIIINNKISDLEFTAIMKMSSLSILPYRKIDQSGVLLTLVEEQIPYCATNVGELCKPFEMGNIGWRFKAPTVQDIQMELESIFRNPSQIEEKKDNFEAWKKIKESFSWDRAANITCKLYNET